MNDINKLYSLWLEKTKDNKAINDELLAVKGNDDEITDRFYRNLEFGTAGLRGILGAGTNRMNTYTVNQATQGLADYLNSEFSSPSVAIAYDSRINSDVFAKEAAGVLAANGVKVYIYPELVPTPMLSFAVRRLKCSSGIVITASHNPSKYNGYKCYDPEGYQMTDKAAQKTYEFIQKVDMFDGVKTCDFEKALASGKIEYISKEIYDEFFDLVLTRRINPGVCEKAALKVIYTPLNGTGNKPVREILRRIGQKNVTVVPEQENPDGNFPTCPFPNPEIRQAFDCALKIAERDGADLLLATDPDCDRVGIAVKDKGEYKLMTGNEVGVLLTEYILSCRKKNGTLPERPVVIKSLVTTDLVGVITEKYGGEIKNLLTGFKYTGECVTQLEKNGEADRFVLGMEESYGYLSGTHARDKDAVVGSMLITEMAAYYKEQGKTLIEVLDEIHKEYGLYKNTLLNFGFEGASGMKKMQDMMSDLRENVPASLGGLEVEAVSDYLTGKVKNIKTGEESETGLPSSNVLRYKLPGNCVLVVRPSGTEPKIKIYITAVADSDSAADEIIKNITADIEKIMDI
ncbi:MAG: phospho-sugar mutase [Clostridiales bacterium]|nr:phospho-sugar mutase [Clostridiales bacterium]